MNAKETPLLKLVSGPKQFLIPIYQRAYSWRREQCARLWDDVVRAGRGGDDHAHFLGSIVYVAGGLYQGSAVPRLLVIDGQQRLTTVTLLLDALGDVLAEREAEGKAAGEITARKLRNYYLRNADEEGDLRYKLLLSHGDTDTLKRLIDDLPPPAEPAERLVDNHAYFCERLRSSKLDPLDIYRGLSRLLVVDISLDRTKDNPQLIFESLNSTGLDLSQGDLVRNYVLMGLEPERQSDLYRTWWREMERLLEEEPGSRAPGRGDPFDRFMRAWLTLALGEVPSLDEVYRAFQDYRRRQPDRPIDELLQELHRFAGHWARVVLGAEQDPELRRRFARLRGLRMDVQWPLVMQLLDHHLRDELSKADLLAILELLESWLFRRAVCNIPANVLSRAMPTLLRELDLEDPVASFARALAARTGAQRMPNDAAFRDALIHRDSYGFRLRKHLLRCLENHDRKEPVAVDELSIEHVIPQNEDLGPQWREMLGAEWRTIRDRWLHRLGNLSWTGYNPELSDRPFAEKRDMKGGYAESPLRLNRGLAKLERFDEAALRARAEELADLALQVWPGHGVPETAVATLQAERRELRRVRARRTLDDLANLQPMRAVYDRFAAVLRERAPELLESINKHYPMWSHPDRPRRALVQVFPQRTRLVARIRVPFAEIESPPDCCRPTSNHRLPERCRVFVADQDSIEFAVGLVLRARDAERNA